MHLAVAVEHNVFWLDVTVREVLHFQAVMDGREQGAEVLFHRLLIKSAAFLFQLLGQVSPRAQPHDQIDLVAARVIDDIMDLDYVRVTHSGKDSHLLGDPSLVFWCGLFCLFFPLFVPSRIVFLLLSYLLLLNDVVALELLSWDDLDSVFLVSAHINASAHLAKAADSEHLMQLVVIDDLICAAWTLATGQQAGDRVDRFSILSLHQRASSGNGLGRRDDRKL